MRRILPLSELRPLALAAKVKVKVRSFWAGHRALAWIGGLIALVLATSWAVATVSWWLVPPYLLVMGFVLFAPPPGTLSDEDLEPSILVGPHATIEPSAEALEELADDDLGMESEAANTPDSDSEAVGVASPNKTRRVKGRGKRGVKTLPELTREATWIQVRPGKFVRVEDSGLANDSLPVVESAGESTSNSADDLSRQNVEEPVNSTSNTQTVEDDLSDTGKSTDVVPNIKQDHHSRVMREEEEGYVANPFEDAIESDSDDMAEDHGNAPEAFDETNDHGNAPEAFAGMAELNEPIKPSEQVDEYPFFENRCLDEPQSVSNLRVEAFEVASVEHFAPQSVITASSFVELDDQPTTAIGQEPAAQDFLTDRKVSVSCRISAARTSRSNRSQPVATGFRCRSQRGLGRKRRQGRRSSIRSPPRICRTR